MARALLEGHPTIFYWGQAYGGPFETWLAAPIVWLFGSTPLSLRIVPICLSAVTAILVWRVGLRTIDRPGALIAASLVWFFPTSLLWRTTNSYVIYAGATMLGVAVVLQVLRVWASPSRVGFFLLGLLSGFALWQSFQLATIIPTAIVWLLIRRSSLVRSLPVYLAGAAVGFLPVIVSNVRNDWWSRDIGHYGNELSYMGRLGQFFTNALPLAFDLRVPVALDWFLWKPVALLLYALVLVALLWRGWSRRGRETQPATELLLAILIAFPFIWAVSPLTTFSLTAGYVVVLVPVLLLGACAFVRTEGQAIVISVLALAFLAHSFVGLGVVVRQSGKTYPQSFYGDRKRPGDTESVIEALDRLGIRRVYAGYWIANNITYLSGGTIIAADMRPEALRTTTAGIVVPLPNDLDFRSRHPSFAVEVAKVAAPAFVLAKAFDPPTTDYRAFEDARYQSQQVGPYTIFHRGAASRGTGR